MPEITVRPVPRSEKHIFLDYFQAYLAELAAYSGARPARDGLFHYDMLDHYWLDERRMPFFIESADDIAGLLLLRALGAEESPVRRPSLQVAEIYVFGGYRRQAVGRDAMRFAARMAAERSLPLTWSAYENNAPANALYRAVLDEFGAMPEEWSVEQTRGADHTGLKRFYYRLVPAGTEKNASRPQDERPVGV